MSGEPAVAHRSRAIALGTLIALSLVMLGMAVTQRTFTANGAPVQLTAPDFVVSSALDAGPGTLRDAILAADRLTSRARIRITAKRITLESALPALVNPHGVDIDAAAGAGIIDARRLEAGPALQISSPTATLRGLRLDNAAAFGIIVNASGVQMDSVTVTNSKVGILLGTAARDCTIRTSIFEGNATGLMGEADVHRVAILSSIFRRNTRAGFWLVAAPPAATAGTASAEQEAAVRERVRIADSVFEGNAAGVVVANQPTLVQKSRFIGNRESAVLILGGMARLEDSEIRGSGGTAISVTSGAGVILARNTLIDNPSTAISVRDSEVVIEGNTLTHNGLGIVSVISRAAFAPVIRDNVVTKTTGDAVTVIGGVPLLQRNRIIGNHGVGLRVLDLVQGAGGLKAAPRLDANVLQGNRIDTPVTGLYTLVSAP